MIKLAIFATHPIQYQVPWFQALAKVEGIETKVYYGFIPDAEQQGKGFGVSFKWDIPMFSGYPWELLDNSCEQPETGAFFGSRLRNVRSLLKRERPDLVLITGWNAYPLMQVLFACMSLCIPRLVRGDSNAMKARPTYIRLTHRALMRCYTAFLYVGRANRQFYENYGVKPHKLFSVPHFIDNERFCSGAKALAPQRKSIRNKWNINPSATCFLYAGKLEKIKRTADLLAALNLISIGDHAVHLLIVGDGELMTQTRESAEKHNLPVTFCGFLNQSEIAKAYVAADCLVLPSDYETWGLVVNEAMACGVPAIVSDRVGCGSDLIRQSETGFCFPFGDVEKLAETMLGFVALTDDQRREMGNRARRLVFEKYSIEAAVEGTIQAISQISDDC